LIRRRPLLHGAAWLGLLACGKAFAQRALPGQPLPRVARISTEIPLAHNVGPDPVHPFARAFVHGLRDLGWVDGRHVVIEHRSAEGHPERLPALLREVVGLPVQAIVTGGTVAAIAARRATATIPIISIGPNLVALGLANSLARPGGNVTGLSFDTGAAIIGKRLEWLKRAVPAVRRIAYIGLRPTAGQTQRLPRPVEVAEAARTLGLELTLVAVEGPDDFDTAFAAMARERPDAIMGNDSPLNIGNRARIIAFAARERLPVVFGLREFAEAGALMSYGVNLPEVERRAALYVDKILRGAQPGELPIEQPTRFELVVNLKTAAALGIKLPQEILLSADDLIQ
jgi:putative ABC transport system substrate-binding protein